MKITLSILFSFSITYLFAQDISHPPQSTTGFGGTAYAHEKVVSYDFADNPDGYTLFVPAAPVPDTAAVILFVHGYGGINPMIYGKWIKHLVRQGNIVIYPRYQRNLMLPRPPSFTKNVVKAIKNALTELEKEQYPVATTDHFAIIGHSYGGVIAGKLAVNQQKYDIPPIKAILMCAPGSGPFKGGRLKSYEKMPSDLKLLVVASSGDHVVGDEFAQLVFHTATNTPDRNYLVLYPDAHGTPAISAEHNECYSLDMEFDTGLRNFTAERALRISTFDPVDYNGYWKWFDALLTCTRKQQYCEYAFGNTRQQASLGAWSDGQEIRLLEVILPEN